MRFAHASGSVGEITVKRLPWVFVGCLVVAGAASAKDELPKPLISGLKNPSAVTVGADGRIYVTTLGQIGKRDGGAVMVLKQGRAVPFATGLDVPMCLAAYGKLLFVGDKKGIWRIDDKGKAKLFVSAETLPSSRPFLRGLAADPESGALYV